MDWLLSDAEPEEPRAEPERAEDWTDKLPRLLRGAARRWGWLAGVYLAVVGALFAGMGALARAVSRSMFESAASFVGDADILTGGGRRPRRRAPADGQARGQMNLHRR